MRRLRPKSLGFSKLARASFRYILKTWCEYTYFEESCVALRGSLDEHTAREHRCVSVGKVPIAEGDRPVWHATEWKAGEANGPSRRQRCTSPALRAPRTSAAGRLEPLSNRTTSDVDRDAILILVEDSLESCENRKESPIRAGEQLMQPREGARKGSL